MEFSQQSATLIFTASTVLMIISLMLLTSTWRTLKELQNFLPLEQRKIYPILRLREIKDKREHNRQVMKNLLWVGSFLFGLNIFLNCCSLISIAGLMTGLSFGPYGPENFNWARYSLFISPLVLFAAILCIGGYRLVEFMDMKAGKLDPVRFQIEESVASSKDESEEKEDTEQLQKNITGSNSDSEINSSESR